MAKIKEPVNLFYVLLIVCGVVFFVTAFAYGAMTYLAIQPRAAGEVTRHPLWTFLDEYGMRLMVVELVALGVTTWGAMWLDSFRQRRAQTATPEENRA